VTDLRPKLPAHALTTIHSFLRGHALATGLDGVVVGLSGGIDSALTARLARDALGPSHVLGVLLPDGGYPRTLIEETEQYGRSLGIETRTMSIQPIVEAFQATLPSVNDRVALGNTKARIRMTLVYAIAREARRLVAGAGNKSELLLGYFTKFGDGGVDLLPIGDLYKTEVRALGKELGLPEPVLARPPTAGLWPGQTDEGELGEAYVDIDRVLRGAEELRPAEEIAAITGLPKDRVRSILSRIEANRHKRRLPPVAKVGLRTVGIDWRE